MQMPEYWGRLCALHALHFLLSFVGRLRYTCVGRHL
jgi:hypothetical protein